MRSECMSGTIGSSRTTSKTMAASKTTQEKGYTEATSRPLNMAAYRLKNIMSTWTAMFRSNRIPLRNNTSRNKDSQQSTRQSSRPGWRRSKVKPLIDKMRSRLERVEPKGSMPKITAKGNSLRRLISELNLIMVIWTYLTCCPQSMQLLLQVSQRHVTHAQQSLLMDLAFSLSNLQKLLYLMLPSHRYQHHPALRQLFAQFHRHLLGSRPNMDRIKFDLLVLNPSQSPIPRLYPYFGEQLRITFLDALE